MRLFLDTNVVMDVLTRREPFWEDARRIMVARFYGDVELWTSMQTFADCGYLLRRVAKGSDVRGALRAFSKQCRVAGFSADDLPDALDSGWPDLEDFLIARCAERVRADWLVTRDAKGFAASKVPVLDPAGFLGMMEETRGIAYEELELG
jgi:predicted nucleic acid-binding protein